VEHGEQVTVKMFTQDARATMGIGSGDEHVAVNFTYHGLANVRGLPTIASIIRRITPNNVSGSVTLKHGIKAVESREPVARLA